MRWFVYTNTRYYPEAVIVESGDTPEEALAVFEVEYTVSSDGVAVFPMDALALWTGCPYPIDEEIEVLP